MVAAPNNHAPEPDAEPLASEDSFAIFDFTLYKPLTIPPPTTTTSTQEARSSTKLRKPKLIPTPTVNPELNIDTMTPPSSNPSDLSLLDGAMHKNPLSYYCGLVAVGRSPWHMGDE